MLTFSLCSVLLLASCDDDSIAPDKDETQYETIRYFWQGAYTSSDESDDGSLVIDALCTGTDVTTTLVFQSYTIRDLQERMYMKGTLTGDQLSLSLDMDRVEYLYESTVEATIGPDSILTGTFSYPDLVADIDCVYHTVDSLAIEYSKHVDGTIYAITSHQDEIWLSYENIWTNGYLRMDEDGNITDTTVVLTNTGALFISKRLTSDGALVWGYLPAALSDPGGVTHGIQLVGFDEEGTISRDFFIPTKASGLASTPSESWLVHSHTNSMLRYDDSGVILDSIPVLVPDLTYLDYDGAYFWSLGHFLRRLYKIDSSGDVVAVFDIPEGLWNYMLVGLLFDDTYIWYAYVHYEYGSMIYKASFTSSP